MDNTEQKIRAPICCIIGNVNAGKTSLMDFLRNSSVRSKEHGNITQKLGMTFFSKNSMENLTSGITGEILIPGITFIDTPGHQCFTSQRVCGITVSDIIILIIDIHKGIEKPTIDCINLLKKYKKPFVLAVNKIDTIQGWKISGLNLKKCLEKQSKDTIKYMDELITNVKYQLLSESLNSELYYKNTNPKEYISLIPISSNNGDAIADLVYLISVLSNKFLAKKLQLTGNINSGFIIDKIHNKIGDLYNVILTDGIIKVNDSLYSINEEGKIIESRISNIFTVHETKEIKDNQKFDPIDKSTDYTSYLIKLSGETSFIVGNKFICSDTKDNIDSHFTIPLNNKNKLQSDGKIPGIMINTSNIGMAMGIAELCNKDNIPIYKSNIGLLNKKQIYKISSMCNNLNNKTSTDQIYNSRYRMILCYDISVDETVQKLCETENIKIITDNVVYKLIEKYQNYCKELDDKIRKLNPNLFPVCKLQILKQYIFHRDTPIVMGVKIQTNKLNLGTVIKATLDKKHIILGRITSIQKNKKNINTANVNEEVCIKIESDGEQYSYGRDFNETYILKSYYNNQDKETLKKYYNLFI